MRLVYPVPTPSSFTQRNIVYKQAGPNRARDGPLSPHRAALAKSLPVFVIFNGFGSFVYADLSTIARLAKAATAHGFAGITLETTEGHDAEDFDSSPNISSSTRKICTSIPSDWW